MKILYPNEIAEKLGCANCEELRQKLLTGELTEQNLFALPNVGTKTVFSLLHFLKLKMSIVAETKN